MIIIYPFDILKIQDNYTALHLAVEAGKSGVVEALLGHGAQVHIRGKLHEIKMNDLHNK